MHTNESIERLRQRFEMELRENSSLYHPIDIERVRTETYQVKRFLLQSQTIIGDTGESQQTRSKVEDKAFVSLCRALQWKKSYGIHDRSDQHFPMEVYELNRFERYGVDREGRVIQWETLRNQRTFKETALLAQQFTAHLIEQVDRAAGEHGFTLITDTTGAGFANIDMELIKFKLAILEYYPQALKAFYIVDLPWLLNSVMKIIVSLMSAQVKQVIHYVKRTELKHYIEPKYIPNYLDGDREKSFYPPNLLRMEELQTKLCLNKKFINTFYKTFQTELDKLNIPTTTTTTTMATS